MRMFRALKKKTSKKYAKRKKLLTILQLQKKKGEKKTFSEVLKCVEK